MVHLQGDYVKALMLQQFSIEIKFAADLMIMGLCMTMHVHVDFIMNNMDMENAIWRAVVLRCHLLHGRLKHLVSYLRAKLGPRAPMWGKDSTLMHGEDLLQGVPIFYFAFSFTIHSAVVEVDAELSARGGCARIGMEDGYFVGS